MAFVLFRNLWKTKIKEITMLIYDVENQVFAFFINEFIFLGKDI